MERAYGTSFLLAVFTIAIWSPAGMGAEIVIDNFDEGATYLFAQNDLYGGPQQAESLETGLLAQNTIGGKRLTWVEAGLDEDPAIAELTLASGSMRFTLDNDEAHGGLTYDDLGGVDLTGGMTGEDLLFDIVYANSGSSSTVVVELDLFDGAGQTAHLSQEIGDWLFGGYSGTYGFALDGGVSSQVDLLDIDDIRFTFWGGVDYWGTVSIDNIRVTPEPVGIVLLGLGAFVVRSRSRVR